MAAVGGAAHAPSSMLRLYVSARSLLNKDALSKSDPCCVVEIKQRQQPTWVKVGRTEMVKNSLNPDFKKTFEIPFLFEEKQELRFRFYDIDNETATLDDDDFLGEATCTVGEIVGAIGRRLIRDLKSKAGVAGTHGRVIASVEEISSSARSSITIQFSGRSLAKKDTFGKSDPYIIISRPKPDGSLQQVHQSETIKNTLNPDWNPVVLDSSVLCNNDEHLRFTITCWDYDKGKNDDQIGILQTSLAEILAASTSGAPLKLNHPKGKSKDVGSLVIRSASSVKMPSFLDYVFGGCEINLMVAVDFTASNKDPRDPSSLHFRNPHAMNEYQHAIMSVGEILQHYDSDKLFPAYGFGARLPDGRTSHCFALNGNPANPYVAGVAGILEAYGQALTNVQLYGPTNFAEIIRLAATTASQHVSQQNQKYFVLLMLTDGEITDLHQTVMEIISASSLPMSIVIIGVGAASFDAMRMLDGDEVALQTGGQRASRDIVQFVEFRRFAHDPAALAAEVLAEIPQQLLGFFMSKKITPNPPAAAPPV